LIFPLTMSIVVQFDNSLTAVAPNATSVTALALSITGILARQNPGLGGIVGNATSVTALGPALFQYTLILNATSTAEYFVVRAANTDLASGAIDADLALSLNGVTLAVVRATTVAPDTSSASDSDDSLSDRVIVIIVVACVVGVLLVAIGITYLRSPRRRQSASEPTPAQPATAVNQWWDAAHPPLKRRASAGSVNHFYRAADLLAGPRWSDNTKEDPHSPAEWVVWAPGHHVPLVPPQAEGPPAAQQYSVATSLEGTDDGEVSVRVEHPASKAAAAAGDSQSNELGATPEEVTHDATGDQSDAVRRSVRFASPHGSKRNSTSSLPESMSGKSYRVVRPAQGPEIEEGPPELLQKTLFRKARLRSEEMEGDVEYIEPGPEDYINADNLLPEDGKDPWQRGQRWQSMKTNPPQKWTRLDAEDGTEDGDPTLLTGVGNDERGLHVFDGTADGDDSDDGDNGNGHETPTHFYPAQAQGGSERLGRSDVRLGSRDLLFDAKQLRGSKKARRKSK